MRRTSDSVCESACLRKRLSGGAGDTRRHRGQGRADARLCHRNQGIGADGVEFLTWDGGRQGKIRLHNADGWIAEIQATALAVSPPGLAYGAELDRAMKWSRKPTGRRCCRIDACRRPGFSHHVLDGYPEVHRERPARRRHVMEGAVVSTGDPRLVIFMDQADFRGYDWETIGAEICSHPQFPHQTNVEFVRLTGRDEIEIRIYERGVGPTSSSGTGTCAAGSAAIALRGAAPVLRVIAPGGANGGMAGPGSEILLTGPAQLVCFGEAW